MEDVAVILYDVPFFVEIQLEDDAVIGLAQIVYRKERPDNVCYPGSEELRVIFVPCNEVASPFIHDLLPACIGIEAASKSVSVHWVIWACLLWCHRCCGAGVYPEVDPGAWAFQCSKEESILAKAISILVLVVQAMDW